VGYMKLLDLFSGIGGFHKGFEQAGFQFEWVGFSEIDKYASSVYKYRFPNAKELGDVNLIQPERLPNHIDFLCGGFPCQAFSMAGKRKGFDDTRGTLFFEIARVLKYFREHRKPIDYFVLENVKGLLSHDNGRTFAAIYRVLTDIGYTIEFQLLNTRWFLPQNRERIYLVGYVGSGGRAKVFPIGGDGAFINELSSGNHSDMDLIKVADYRFDEGLRVRKESISPTLHTRKHSATDISTMPPFVWKETKDKIQTFTERSFDGKRADGGRAIRYHKVLGETPCLTSQMGMGGNNVPMLKVGELKIIAKKRSHDTPKEINKYLKANKHGKTIQDIATNLSLPKTQVEHYFRSDKYRAVPNPEHWLLLKKYLGFDDTYDKHVTEIYEKEVEFETSRRVYSSDGISKTLDTHERGYYQHKSNIRRLTPTECERLQGFPDGWTSKGVMDGKVVPMSDTQRYKQCGNAVTVNVVQAVAEKILEVL